jgi:hypothetical protein
MDLNIFELFHSGAEIFFAIRKILGKESVLGPIHHFGTTNEFMANLAPLVRYFPYDKRFSLHFYCQHIVVVVLIDSMFGEHESLLSLADIAVFLIIEEMTREINVEVEILGVKFS